MELFKRSFLGLAILNILDEQGESYGYQLLQAIKRRTRGKYDPKIGTLYPLLYQLEKDGLIQGESRPSPAGPPRRYFTLTPKGRKHLGKERRAFQVLRDLLSHS